MKRIQVDQKESTMLEKVQPSAEVQARAWISAFAGALAKHDAAALSQLFGEDSHWRNLCGISWQIVTFSGSRQLSGELCRRVEERGAQPLPICCANPSPGPERLAGPRGVQDNFC